MPQSPTMNKIGPVWSFLQFLWSMKRIIAIISMLTALVYLMASETLEQRRTMLADFNKSEAIIADFEAAFKASGDRAFGGSSRDGRSMTVELAENLYTATQTLRSELATLSAPNSGIQVARDSYVKSLTNLQGKLNLFEVGAEGTISVLEALDEIERPAANFRKETSSYQNSVLRSLWAAF
jgi:hypothetical protein